MHACVRTCVRVQGGACAFTCVCAVHGCYKTGVGGVYLCSRISDSNRFCTLVSRGVKAVGCAVVGVRVWDVRSGW
jgi:hypothetical protein